jgi:hypothetical protein
LGIRAGAELAGEQLWYTKRFFALAAPLPPPAPRPAKVEIEMQPVDARSFGGFRDELSVAAGSDYVQVLLRRNLGRDGPGELYVAEAEDGRPIYAQMLPVSDADRVIWQNATG